MATTSKPQAPAPAKLDWRTLPPSDRSRLFDEVMKATDTTAIGELYRWLKDPEQLDQFRKSLPDRYKNQAERYLQRLRLAVDENTDLKACDKRLLWRCALTAGSFGYAIDGKLVTIIAYKGKPSLSLDYKVMCDIARRNGSVKDCWARVVLHSDVFSLGEVDGKVTYNYQPNLTVSHDHFKDEELVGVLGVAVLPDCSQHVQWMSAQDVFAIRAGSPANKPHLPWGMHVGQMATKSGLKRTLKLFQADPELAAAMDADEAVVSLDDVVIETARRQGQFYGPVKPYQAPAASEVLLTGAEPTDAEKAEIVAAEQGDAYEGAA